MAAGIFFAVHLLISITGVNNFIHETLLNEKRKVNIIINITLKQFLLKLNIMENQATKYTAALIVAAVLFIIWGVLGVMDSKNFTYSGFITDGDNTIIKVEDNSPASVAGFQVGDVIKKNGGISVTDTKALTSRGRAKIGEVREFVVERAGDELTLQLTFAAMNSKDRALNIVAFIIGLFFIVLGVYAHNKIKTLLSLSFAVFALCFGFNFMFGLYASDELLRKIINGFGNTVVLFSIAALAGFMLKYPPQSNFLNKKGSHLWLYIPAAALIIFIWILIFVQPESTSSLNQFMRILFGVFIVGYFGLALITLIIKYAKSNTEERKSRGLNLLLWGAIIGLVPILIIFIIQTVSPKTILPGNDYIFITFIAIPIFFTMALIKQDKVTPVE